MRCNFSLPPSTHFFPPLLSLLSFSSLLLNFFFSPSLSPSISYLSGPFLPLSLPCYLLTLIFPPSILLSLFFSPLSSSPSFLLILLSPTFYFSSSLPPYLSLSSFPSPSFLALPLLSLCLSLFSLLPFPPFYLSYPYLRLPSPPFSSSLSSLALSPPFPLSLFLCFSSLIPASFVFFSLRVLY